MTAKPVVLGVIADQDVDAAMAHYAREAGERLAVDFMDAMHVAIRRIAEQPGAGSPRHAHQLDVPGLRTQALKRFPYRAFYIERPDRIDVWRVLHGSRDIPAPLLGDNDDSDESD